ncbi:MAG: gliding motility protein GldN [Ferruginibacter sp.]
MKKSVIKLLLLLVLVGGFSELASAQAKKTPAKKRTSAKRTTKTSTNAKVVPAQPTVDTVAAVVAIAPAPAVDSLPIKRIAKSLRRDAAVIDDEISDRTPLAYEHLRADDAVYRHKIWREIDTREKINLPFRYSADENNGNQRFISILLQAIQDSLVTVFSNSDDRFTTPMTKSDIAKAVAGEPVDVPLYNENGEITGYKKMVNDINFDYFYKFRIKEEVIFDKESSRLFWRILGIAPVKNVITSQGVVLGETELFWVYYPDMRGIFAKYEVYNGKNLGARMSWEELFESRMFYGRIIKSTIDNPYDQFIKNYKGLTDNKILQLLEGESIKEKIFTYEQNLWSY